MKISAVAVVAVVGVALSGCASIIEGSSQKVSLSTAPVSGARCQLSNPEGHWTLTTPGTVKVARSKEDMKVRCHKDGYRDFAGTIPSDLEEWTLLNIPILPAMAVDAATGAINSYPDKVRVPMRQGGYSSAPPAEQPDQDQNPDQQGPDQEIDGPDQGL